MSPDDIENYFYQLSDQLFAQLHATEIALLYLQGEQTDFVRFNRSRIRQAGYVTQSFLRLRLLAGSTPLTPGVQPLKQATVQLTLSGDRASDEQALQQALTRLREQLPHLPHDPYLNIATSPVNTHHNEVNRLPPASAAVSDIVSSAKALDLVGLWASGAQFNGFTNSLGQRNWHNHYSFNLDWSIYGDTVTGDTPNKADAVKQNYAGFDWDPDYFRQNIAYTEQTMALLRKPEKSLHPGRYRAFLTPTAIKEIMQLLGQDAFGLKNQRTRQSPLLKLDTEDLALHPGIRITEEHKAGLTPAFTPEGFIKPERIELITEGKLRHCLTDARSAREYDRAVNTGSEAAQSLHIDGGQLHQNDVLSALDTGVFISNLWYCNHSDRNNCRITGLTRFACLWVENGKAVAPLDVMRFDNSVLRMLGDDLIDLTREHETWHDPECYHQRSSRTGRFPGALVNNFTFTL